jgi:hypothetical protein
VRNFSYFPALGGCFKYYVIWVLCPQLSKLFFFLFLLYAIIVSSIVLVNDDFNVSVAS